MEFVINTSKNSLHLLSMKKGSKVALPKSKFSPKETKTEALKKNSPIKRSNQVSQNFKGPHNEQNQTCWDLIEFAKVSGNQKCPYKVCYHFPCWFKHAVKDYDEIGEIYQFKQLLQQRHFRKLCSYNIGDEEEVRKVLKNVNWRTNNAVQTIADFLRYIDERVDYLLRPTELKIELYDVEDDEEAKRKTQLLMISYIFARFYILYYREEVATYGVIFENAIKSSLQFLLQDQILNEIALSLIFHLSRSFVDSHPLAFEGALTALQDISTIQILENPDAKQIIDEAEQMYQQEIIKTKGFQMALIEFLKTSTETNKPIQNTVKTALEIIKSLKVELVDGVQFNGMCGHNAKIYIAPKQAFSTLTRREVKIARALAILIHESAHHLVRCIGHSFEVITPRGLSEITQLEAGYRLEYLIVGKLFKFKYWEVPSAFLNLANWNQTPIPFTKDEEERIREHSREIRNPSQSGIEDGQHLALEI